MENLDNANRNELFIKTDLGNYFNVKYMSSIKHVDNECFYVSQLLDYANIGIVCKKNNKENYNILKEYIGAK